MLHYVLKFLILKTQSNYPHDYLRIYEEQFPKLSCNDYRFTCAQEVFVQGYLSTYMDVHVPTTDFYTLFILLTCSQVIPPSREI